MSQRSACLKPRHGRTPSVGSTLGEPSLHLLRGPDLLQAALAVTSSTLAPANCLPQSLSQPLLGLGLPSPASIGSLRPTRIHTPGAIPYIRGSHTILTRMPPQTSLPATLLLCPADTCLLATIPECPRGRVTQCGCCG